ncbi:hypothetical protein [Rhizobium sp. AC44/96]|uniref:hypothetical protein n=1 Tax=Rhizobium sp. AC44/96 TaxID=1841654 RepID=UPI001146CC52|nr:hypothetical protein [Rhizobium sp. AC44/96]
MLKAPMLFIVILGSRGRISLQDEVRDHEHFIYRLSQVERGLLYVRGSCRICGQRTKAFSDLLAGISDVMNRRQ